jgi:hypothetical protein
MRHVLKQLSRLLLARRPVSIGLLVSLVLALAPAARAGQLAWLDEVVQQVVREARVGGRAAIHSSAATATTAQTGGRLFVNEADDGLGLIVRRSEDMARYSRGVYRPTEALLQARFARLSRHDPEAVRAFKSLAPAEKWVVVEMGETAQRLARRYPGEAETMIRRLGTEGLSAVHVFGDDVAEGLVKEGPESLGVLRKTGRGGWSFFTHEVLPHKKKLVAAGVLAAFLANPDKFVDYAGRATDYAVSEFARAGIQIAGAVGGGAAHGLETAISQTLANHGLDFAVLRYAGMTLAGLVIVVASLVLIGVPGAWLLGPLKWPLRALLARPQDPTG